MGRLLLVCRLATRDLRRRPAEAVLLLLALMTATATLALGLVLDGVAADPYGRTRAATAGPDVVATAAPEPEGEGAGERARRAEPGGLERLARAPGVVGHGGPYPVTGAILEAPGRTATAQVEGRDAAGGAVDRPRLMEGRWAGDRAAVVEAGFAEALGLRAGDQVTLGGREFRIAGIAVTAAVPPYPHLPPPGTAENQLDYCPVASVRACQDPAGSAALRRADFEHPGLVWVTEKDALDLAPRAEAVNYVMSLRLADPDAAPAFVTAHADVPGTGRGPAVDEDSLYAPALVSWQQLRHHLSTELERGGQQALLIGSRLLGLLAIACIAVLVGGRMAAQTRRVGLLKAVGGTPAAVAAVLLAQYVAVALLAAAAGLAAAWFAAPHLAEPGAGLLGAPGRPAVTAGEAATVTALAVGITVAATLLPAVRAARTSTVRALAATAVAPRRTAWLNALTARLPVPLLLGLRIGARRPRRAVLATVAIAVTVSGMVAVTGVRAEPAEDLGSGVKTEQLDQALLVLTATLVALAAVNVVFIAWSTALDTRHSAALARALGATPAQVGAALSAAQIPPALAGAALGIPGGLALLQVASDTAAPPQWGVLLAAIPATVLAVAALTVIPVRLAARRSPAEVLSAELA